MNIEPNHDATGRTARARHVVAGILLSAAIVGLVGLALAPLAAIAFFPGFFAGLVLWLARPMRATWARVRLPYLVALGAYVVHRIDEEVSRFVPAMEELTGRQAVDVASPVSIVLVVLALAWMLSPLLLRTGHPLGHFGAWSVFAAFGLVEPWHFLFPLFSPDPYGYFPGMITAPIIAAAGWWGMWRMWRETRTVRGERMRAPG
jgi:hypothetical protein